MPIRLSVPLLVAAPAFLVAVLLTAVMLFENRTTVSDLTAESVEQVHLRIQQRLTNLMAATERVGRVVASLVERGYLPTDDLPSWQPHLLDQQLAFPELSGVTWGAADGRTVWIARFPGEDEYQFCLKTEAGGQARRYRLDARGVLAPEPHAVYDYDPRERPWYQQATTREGVAWLEPYVWTSRAGGKPVGAVAVARPVYRDGRLLGVLNCTFTLPHLSDFLKSLKVGSSGAAFILDQSQELMASGLAPDSELLKAARSHLSEDNFTLNGRRYLLVTSEFRYPEGLRQTVVTVVPEEDLAAGAYQARVKALWVTLLAVAFSLLVGWRLAATIVTPIAGLVGQVRALERSREQCSVPPLLAQRSDELAELSAALVSLAEEVTGAEERLRQNERYYRSLIENSSDITMVCDQQGRVSYVSPAVERLGLSAEQVKGSRLLELLDPGDQGGVEGVLERAYQHPEQVFELEYRLGGRYLQALVVGTEGRLVVNARDVTERKRLSELEQEKAAVEAASRARTAFLANITHELRTPMNSIIGFTDFLKRRLQDLSERDRDALETIERNAKHLLKLVEGVLDLGKIESGRTELAIEEFSVRELVEDVYRAVQPLAAQSGSRCELSCADELGTMHSDLTKTRQILYNLLANACKFTLDGSIELKVYTRNETVVFQVVDTGIGMSPDQQTRVFEPFAQADPSIAKRFGGTGLGLSLTRSFCEMLGGSIDLKSELGVGSTFTVRLPRRALPEAK